MEIPPLSSRKVLLVVGSRLVFCSSQHEIPWEIPFPWVLCFNKPCSQSWGHKCLISYRHGVTTRPLHLSVFPIGPWRIHLPSLLFLATVSSVGILGNGGRSSIVGAARAYAFNLKTLVPTLASQAREKTPFKCPTYTAS